MKKIYLVFLLTAGFQPALASADCATLEEQAIREKIEAELKQLDAVDAYLRARLHDQAGGLWSSELSTVQKLIEGATLRASRLSVTRSKILIRQTNCLIEKSRR